MSPLQLTGVLAQLPLDVVQQSCFDHLERSDLPNLKLVSKAFAQLVRQHASLVHLFGVDLQLEHTELSAQVRTLDLYAAARDLYIEIEYSTDVGGLTVCGQEEVRPLRRTRTVPGPSSSMRHDECVMMGMHSPMHLGLRRERV